MPTFSYRARDLSGQETRGTLVADTVAAATRLLGDRSLMPVAVDEVQTADRSLLTGRARRVKLAKIGLMYEQLADLLRAGVPMLRALSVLCEQSASPALSRVLRELREDVSGGDSLADAMARHPHAFPELHASMIRAGEKGGFLEDVLSRLAEFVHRQDMLRNKFIGAMIYPCVLLLGAIGAVVFIMTFVVPGMRGVLEGQTLPWATRVVFGVSDALRQHYLVILGAAVVVVGAVVAYLRSAMGQAIMARVKLRAPGFGRVYTMVSLCRFCRVFGTLLANGIPILQSLKIAKDSTGNPILAEVVDRAAENVRHGEPLAAPLAASKVFPPVIVDMISVAEESNTLDKVLVEIAETQEQRTSQQIDFVVRLLEPLMLLLMGVMIGFIAIALLLPILLMATSQLKQ
ncbi:MAG: type II secretion system F family protein [Phycisphaerae bacterium]|jgi:general secretion pathway protein F/type IV pilus assembly protein PilC